MAVRGDEHMQRVREGGTVRLASLTAVLSGGQVAAPHSFKSEMDDFAHDGTQVYWLCQGRQNNSKFFNAVLERKLKMRTTLKRISMLENWSRQLKS